jgi:hypothetical protein
MEDLKLGQYVRLNAQKPCADEVSQAVTLSTVQHRHAGSLAQVVERVIARWAEVQNKDGKPPKAILKEEAVYKLEVQTRITIGGDSHFSALKEVVIATRNQIET